MDAIWNEPFRGSKRARGRHGASSLLFLFHLLLAAGMLAPVTGAQEKPADPLWYVTDTEVGVDEKLGAFVPLDLTFRDEEGKEVKLRDLVTRPTVLLLVYLRCPSICSPLMHEVADTVDKLDLVPGIDFDILTVSFDAREGPELAATAKTNLLAGMKRKVPPESWRFLTGDGESIARLARSVGFKFMRDKEDFDHPATVIFLSREGKIVRYLGGLKLLPADMKMAVLDAAEGRPRTLMQRIQQLCFAYDPEGKTYVFMVNRIVLFVTVVVLGAFLAWLLLRRRRRPGEEGGAP